MIESGALSLSSQLYESFFNAVAPRIQKLQLSHLDWTTDEVHTLAPALQCCTSLRVLDLAGNRFDGPAIRVLATALQHHKRSLKLVLFDNPLDGQEGTEAVINLIEACPAVVELNVGLCRLSADGMTTVLGVWKKCRTGVPDARIFLEPNGI